MRISSRQNARAHFYASCAGVCAQILTKNLLMILYYLMNISLKFHIDLSFRCRDICKTVLTFKSHQFSMYFPYFHSYTPEKSSKMDNYWTVMEFFGNNLSKCTYVMVKKTPVSVYRLLSSPSNKNSKNAILSERRCKQWQNHHWTFYLGSYLKVQYYLYI